MSTPPTLLMGYGTPLIASVLYKTCHTRTSSTSFGWGKGGNVTSAGWQVTLCDPIWHVSSRSGVATLRTATHLLLTYFAFTHTHTHPFNGPFSGTTQASQYQKGKTNLDFTEARDSEWHWHQQICKSASRSRQITTPVPHHSSFLQAGCPSCRPTNSVKALKALAKTCHLTQNDFF